MKEDDLNAIFEEETTSNDEPEFDSAPFDTDDEKDYVKAESKIQAPDGTISIDLGKDKFSALLSVIKIMKPSCQDMIIKGGKIIQSTTKKHFIFSIDISAIVGNIDLIIPSIAQRLPILEVFKKQNVDMFLDVHSTGYIFRDSRSAMKYRKALESFSEKCMTMDEVLSKLLPDFDKPIFTLDWDKMLLERTRVVSETIAIPVLNIDFKGDRADIHIKPSENISAECFDITSLNDELDDTSLNNMAIPFSIDSWISMLDGGIEEIKTELYFRKTTTPSACMILSGQLPIGGTDLSVSVKIYTGSIFQIKDEDNK